MAFPKDILIPPLQSVHLPAFQETCFPKKRPLPVAREQRLPPGPIERAGILQHSAAGAGRSPGGVNVIQQQNIASRQPLGMRHKKSAAQILPALMGGRGPPDSP